MPDETLLKSKVPPDHSGLPLLDYLTGRFRYQDRAAWETLIVQGKVTVNEGKASPDRTLQKGDWVEYRVVLKEPPVDRDIRILHEERTFLVAIKPGQLPSHADGNFIKNTFIHILTENLRATGWKGDVRLVHRLDRETSGLMVVAKDKKAHKALTEQFEAGTVGKEYLAVARGRIAEQTFEVAGSIGRDPESQVSVRQKVVPEGTPFSKPSLTRFEKLQDLKDATLLRCIPKTGRTNQIRVHLDSTGHPIVGDKLYGRTDAEFLEFVHHVKAGGSPVWEGHAETPRHLLHASKIMFKHPETGETLTFEADMPNDFKNYLESHSESR